MGDDRVKMIEKLKPEYAAIFPSFNQGQEMKEKSSVPEPGFRANSGKSVVPGKNERALSKSGIHPGNL